MNAPKGEAEKKELPGGTDRAEADADEAVNLDAIDRFLKEGLNALPVEKVSRDSLQAQVMTPLEVAMEKEAPEVKPAPEASVQKPVTEFDPGLSTLILKKGFGDMEIRISPDRMTAVLAVFDPRRSDISVEEVVAALEESHIVFGIDERAIQAVLRAATKRGKVALSVIIARGIPVVEGQDARFLLECLDDKTEGAGLAPELTADILSEMEKVHKVFRDGLEYLKEEPLRAIRVYPGECILRKLPHQEGTKGTSVFGREHLPQSGHDVILKTGLNVRLSEDNLSFYAEIFGYLVVQEEKLSVIPSVLLSKDKMTAYFVNLPPFRAFRPISEPYLREAIARMGISHGIDEQAIARLCSGQIDERLVVIAQGTAPVDGQNGQTNLQVAVAVQPGKILEDGTIDFKERNAVANVPEGELIAVYTRATKGIPGSTITRVPVKAANGKEARPRVGANVRVEEQGETVQFFANTTGHVRFFNNRLSVQARYLVPSDVNFKTGNIHFVGDVEITGSVMTGFTVRAGGSVTITGSVETGAHVEAGEDVIVSHGIVGPTASVKAMGDVLARFIASAAVEAKGNVVVGSYIHNATVSAGSHIRVHGRGRLKRKTSAVVGGSLLAGEGIRVASAGSTFGSQTRLIAGVDLGYLEQMQKLRAGIEFCDLNSVRILRTLRVTAITPESVQRVIQNALPEKRKVFVLLVAKLQELARHRRKFLEEQEQVKQRQDERLRQAVIRVDGIAFSGVRAQIGEVAAPVLTALEGVRFRLDAKERKIVLGAILENME